MIRASQGRSLALAGLLVLGCKAAANDGVALVGATLIDGTGGPAMRDAVIVVRRGRIESVGERGGFELPRKTREVDVSGRWIIPGLIDAHAHLGAGRNLGASPLSRLGRHHRTRRAWRHRVHRRPSQASQTPARRGGPRVYAAGAMIDGLPATYPDAIGVNSEKEARKGVDRLVTAGADLIKVYTRIDAPLLRAIVDEAKAFNLSVTAHLGMTDAVTAAKAGIAAIEHMSGVPEAASRSPSALFTAHYRGFFPGWTASARSWADLDSAALARVAQRLAEAKITIVPTLVLHETLSRLRTSRGLLRDPALEDVPEEQQRDWDVPGMINRAGWTDTDFDAFRRSRPMQDLFLRAFAAAGGRIAAGTDASNQMLVPGYSEHREMELLVRAGLTPARGARGRDPKCGGAAGRRLAGAPCTRAMRPTWWCSPRIPSPTSGTPGPYRPVMARGHLLDADSIRASW